MTATKTTAFLMCPIRSDAAPGGSPEAIAIAVRHIKKTPGARSPGQAALRGSPKGGDGAGRHSGGSFGGFLNQCHSVVIVEPFKELTSAAMGSRGLRCTIECSEFSRARFAVANIRPNVEANNLRSKVAAALCCQRAKARCGVSAETNLHHAAVKLRDVQAAAEMARDVSEAARAWCCHGLSTFPKGLTQNSPLHVWSQFFAPDACQPLDIRADFSWNLLCLPARNGSPCATQLFGKRRLASGLLASALQGLDLWG